MSQQSVEETMTFSQNNGVPINTTIVGEISKTVSTFKEIKLLRKDSPPARKGS